ncbi:MAG: PspC domain-containing protein [Ekhidna sp.]|nr:PspC domain-containing protein [Ekhidna sp.]
MKKNISINIGGIIFHIEEDGFDKLKSYLDSVNKYFSSFEGNKEIIEDIEGRIAEIFLGKLDDGKQIIMMEDIDELIATMGTTKDFEATIESEPEVEQETTEKEEPKKEDFSEKAHKKGKRLYRDNKRRVIGGVASGLANYFGINSIWIRLIMLALLFNILSWGLSGFMFITYIIFWIAVPGNDNLEEDKKIKKLYRNSEDKVLGGISSGIASYFGIDPVVMRVIFAGSIFLGGAGFIAYIILWIITPEAKTITEKMQMQGESVTLSGIEENLKKRFRVNEGEENIFVKILLFPFRLIALIFKTLEEVLRPLLKFAIEFLRMAAGALLVLLGSMLMLAFTVVLAVLTGIGNTFKYYVSFGDFPAEELFNSADTLVIVFSYVAVMVPSLALTLLGLVIILKRRVISTYIAWSLFGLWLLASAGLALTIPHIISNYSADGSYVEEKTFIVESNTPTLYLNDLDLKGYNSVDLKLRGHTDSGLYILKMDFESRGYSKANARENAEAVDYIIKKENGDFYFDSGITFGEAPFRFQNVNATFYIPNGKVFRLNGELKEILKNTLWMYDYSAGDMEDNDWIFEEDGSLKCLTCPKQDAHESFRKHGNDTQSYQFKDFDEVKLVSMFDFEIVKSNEYSVRVEGDEDDLDDVFIGRDGDELEVRFRKDWDWWRSKDFTDKVKIYITMPELKYLQVSGACEGKVENFTNQDISFDIAGASEVRADIFPEYLGADLSGASKLILVGRAEELEVDLAGASKLDAFSFRVKDADIESKGASGAKVYAEYKLRANASGASSIRYRGPAEISSNSNGLSSIRKD